MPQVEAPALPQLLLIRLGSRAQESPPAGSICLQSLGNRTCWPQPSPAHPPFLTAGTPGWPVGSWRFPAALWNLRFSSFWQTNLTSFLWAEAEERERHWEEINVPVTNGLSLGLKSTCRKAKSDETRATVLAPGRASRPGICTLSLSRVGPQDHVSERACLLQVGLGFWAAVWFSVFCFYFALFCFGQ